MMYYMSGDRGDPNHEKALEAFANAILADPERYGPIVTSRMRSYAYEWEDDLNQVLQRLSKAQTDTSTMGTT